MSFIFQSLFFIVSILVMATNIYTINEFYKAKRNANRVYPIKWLQLVLTSFLAIFWVIAIVVKWV